MYRSGYNEGPFHGEPMTRFILLCLAIALAIPPSSAAGDALSQIKDLENKYFERTFDKDSEEARLDRLESFIFGSSNKGSADQRLESIEAVVAANAPPKPAVTSAPPKPQTPNYDNEAPGDYPHVSTLESDLLGQTYENEGLHSRLKRLEMKAFGSPSQDPDLSDRVDRLERYDTDHNPQARKREAAERQQQTAFQDIGPASPSAGFRSSNPLLNFGASGGSPKQSYSPSQSVDYGEDPGEVARQRALEQQMADANRPEPPSPQERTLSRVAWCEKQMFSQTYPQMHLVKRLRQLNDLLFPGDKESDMQLMDRIDLIVKTVVLRKHPG